MKKFILALLIILGSLNTFSQSFGWAVGSNTYDYGKQTYIDSSGNIYVRGNNKDYSTGSDIFFFLAKYDSLGNFQWAIDSIDDTRASIKNGSIYITNHSSSLYRLSKYDLDGNLLWSIPTNNGFITDVQADNAGNAVITGIFSGTITFGAYTLSNGGMSCGADYFVAKYDPTGICLWAKQSNGCSLAKGTSVCVDNTDNVLIYGDYIGSIIVDDTSFTSGSQDGFIVKYDPIGNYTWGYRVIGGVNWITSIATNGNGEIYAGGWLGGSVTIAGTTFVRASMWQDIFLLKLDQNGQELWGKQISGPWKEELGALAVNEQNELYATGCFGDPTNFGSTTLSNSGYYEPFLAKYDSLGNNLWAVQFGGGGSGYSMALQNNKIIVAGSMGGTVDFGGHPLTFPPNAMFITQLSDNNGPTTGTYKPMLLESTTLSVSPNPGTGLFQISYSSASNRKLKLRVLNSNGQLIYSEEIPANSVIFNRTIDLSGQAKGIYSVEIVGEKKREVMKIVLN
jgi:hypothetical protein